MKYNGGDKPTLGRAAALSASKKDDKPKSTMSSQASMVKSVASKLLTGRKK